jgi:hypothetical protein
MKTYYWILLVLWSVVEFPYQLLSKDKELSKIAEYLTNKLHL